MREGEAKKIGGYHALLMSNRALMHMNTGKYSQAESLFQQALEIQRKGEGRGSVLYGDILHNLASLNMLQSKYGQAERLYKEALKVRQEIEKKSHPHYVQALTELAVLYAATSRKFKALDILRESVSAEDKIVDHIFLIASDRQRMSFIGTIRRTWNVFLSLVLQQFLNDQKTIRDALNLVMKRKSIVGEAIRVQRGIVLIGKYPQLKSIVLELNSLRKEIAQKTLAGPLLGETLNKYKENLERMNSKKEKLETDLARHIPEIQIQQSLKTINSKTISKTLPDQTALIEFVRINNYNFQAISANAWHQHIPHYLAFILRSRKPDNVQLIDLGDARLIDNMVTHFRMSIIEAGEGLPENEEDWDDYSRHLVASDTSYSSSYYISNNSNNVANWIEIGHELYKLIFHPLLNAIGKKEDCKRLFIAPDGDLSRLPFEVLPTSKGNSGTKLLIDDYSITYLTTARDILQVNKVSDGLPNEPIVAADPDFDLDINSSSSNNGIKVPNNIHTRYGHDATLSEKEVIIKRGIASGNRISRDFDRSTINFERLEGTKYEGEEISKLLCVQPWMGGKVLESKIKSSGSPKILHIATHGFFLNNQDDDLNKEKESKIIETTEDRRGISGIGSTNKLYALAEALGVTERIKISHSTQIFDRLSSQNLEDPMLRSGLALAGANTWIKGRTLSKEAEDGILTAEDVSGMDLTDTELVVLSACETGLGQIHTSEGVFGLRRSFVLAGAKTLVMSLWKVPDEQTKELMVDFYKRLLSGKGRAEALREAQLAMKEKYPNPYYWGAFICQGNPGPMLLHKN